MKSVITAMKARRNLGEILNRVLLRDEEIIIERAGKKVAKLVKIDSKNKKSERTGKMDFRDAAGLGKELWRKININDYLQKEREQWD